MDPKLIEARGLIVKAREALRRGDKNTAGDLGEKAALLMPDLEDSWLILTAADSNPEDALAYAHKALELNPESPRARKAVDWAENQLKKARAGNVHMMAQTVQGVIHETPAFRQIEVEEKKMSARPRKNPNSRKLIYAGVILGLLLCAVVGVAAWSAINNPALAALLPISNVVPTQEALWAQVDVAKPTATPLDVSAFVAQPTAVIDSSVAADAPTPVPTDVPTLEPTPTAIPTEAPTSTPEATETPGVMAMEIVADTPTSAYAPPANPVIASGIGKGGGRWIDVNLSTQSVYAYEGDMLVNSFVVSTGTWRTPTVTGKYKIWIKLRSAPMSGPGYYLPNVPYIMYFYKGYGLHGTYWHNNFGTPMSHGCVNLRTSDAEWLFNWASVGTVVNVHY